MQILREKTPEAEGNGKGEASGPFSCFMRDLASGGYGNLTGEVRIISYRIHLLILLPFPGNIEIYFPVGITI